MKELVLAVVSFMILCFVSNRLINSRYFQKKRSGNNEISDSAIRTMMSCAKQVIEMVAAGNQKKEILNIIPELRQSGEIIESAIDTWKRNIKVHYGTYKQILEQNVTVNKYDVTVASNCEFENGEVIITFEFRENFCMTKVEFNFSGIQEEYIQPIVVDKQEALHTKKQKDTSKKNEKFKVRKLVITCILAVVVSYGLLFYMQGDTGSFDNVLNIFQKKNLEEHEYSIIAEIAIRKEPYEGSERIGTLYRGATVQVKKRSGNWGCTEIDGQPCWFSLKYARLVE